MKEFNSFIFKDYDFNESTKVLSLHYGLDQQINFNEKFKFDFDFVDFDRNELDRAIQTLFYLAGVSYFKAFLPGNIVLLKGDLDKFGADFLSKTYERGLGEFWYVNSLNPKTKISFPTTQAKLEAVERDHGQGLLIGLGGGKDSLVVVEGLRNSGLPLTTWSLGHRSQLEPLVHEIGLKHLYVERTIDPHILELNSLGALNGHIPISAIFGAVGAVVAILSGNRDVVVGNEQTANEPTLTYRGVEINHQYSKTQEFEQDFQNYLMHNFGTGLRYYSFLRPLTELRIAEIFSIDGFSKYLGVFSSCNRAYTLSSDKIFWCGECSKCAFIFMVFTPFIERSLLESIWNGKNLLLDKTMVPIYKTLLGIEGNKPLDCVGEIKESRAAMRLCQKIYPELKSQYEFILPDDYDYKTIYSSEMPADIIKIFNSFIAKF